MRAVILYSGKQYLVSKGDCIDVQRIDVKPGKTVTIKDVLLTHAGNSIDVGMPNVKNASVVCEVVKNKRGPKTTAFKYKRRKAYRRKVGHRQDLTTLKVTDIKTG
jgi:large subunit ribosomal protein L21